MTNKLTQPVITAWHTLVHFFEHGDLVPLMVLVSAVHYASVLNGKDGFAVAIAVGLLVDLGHFRTVRAAVRYSVPKSKASRSKKMLVRVVGRFNSQLFVRWLMVCVMTAISLAYHQRYYADWWLSVPLPLLIAFLAWQQYTDRGVGGRKQVAVSTQVIVPVAQPIVEPAQPIAQEPQEPALKAFVCTKCLRSFDNQQALAAHSRAHGAQKAKTNGNSKEKVSV